MIVEAAYELTRAGGWESVSARSLARKLGSSTMPLYSSLSSMDEIKAEVTGKAAELMNGYQRKPFDQNPLMSSAIGYIAFARDEPRLFGFLYRDRPPGPPGGKSVDRDGSGARQAFAESGVAELEDQAGFALDDPMILKNWIFVHGLASLLSARVLDLADERIKSLLVEAAIGFHLQASFAQGEEGGEKHE
jgi:AcrR family transcriptional regulator